VVGTNVPDMAIAHSPGLVLDCPDPAALASFYGALLGWRDTVDADGSWADLHGERPNEVLSFQRVEAYRAPRWPEQDAPQQMHLDLMVADLDEGEAEAVRLGATRHEHQPGTTFRVLLDPAGHPFCLCVA
jgi:catechol 2,3-dioxygenase-like lactoylglutathione lyase family enzyme